MILDPFVNFLQQLGLDLSSVPTPVLTVIAVGLLLVALRIVLRVAGAILRVGCTVLTVIAVLLILAELFL